MRMVQWYYWGLHIKKYIQFAVERYNTNISPLQLSLAIVFTIYNFMSIMFINISNASSEKCNLSIFQLKDPLNNEFSHQLMFAWNRFSWATNFKNSTVFYSINLFQWCNLYWSMRFFDFHQPIKNTVWFFLRVTKKRKKYIKCLANMHQCHYLWTI